MLRLIRKARPATSCPADALGMISARDISSLISAMLNGKIPLRIVSMDDFVTHGDIILDEARLHLEACAGRLVIRSTLSLVDAKNGDITDLSLYLDGEIIVVPERLLQTLRTIARCAWVKGSMLSHNASSKLINHAFHFK